MHVSAQDEDWPVDQRAREALQNLPERGLLKLVSICSIADEEPFFLFAQHYFCSSHGNPPGSDYQTH